MRVLVIAILLLVTSANGHAERARVVVLAFDGNGQEARSEVISALKSDFMVLSLKTWKKRAADLSASAMTAPNIKRVAKALRVRAVIHGRSASRRNGYVVTLDVKSGQSGRSVATPTLTMTKEPTLDKASKKAFGKLVRQIKAL